MLCCYRIKNFTDTFKNHNYVMLPITLLKRALKKAARKWVFLFQTFQNFCHVINNLFWYLDVIEPILQPHYLVILYLSALFLDIPWQAKPVVLDDKASKIMFNRFRLFRVCHCVKIKSSCSRCFECKAFGAFCSLSMCKIL